MMSTQTTAAPAPVGVDLADDAALDDWSLRFTADNEDLGCQFEID